MNLKKKAQDLINSVPDNVTAGELADKLKYLIQLLKEEECQGQSSQVKPMPPHS